MKYIFVVILFLLFGQLHAQNKITGFVNDKQSQPLIGGTVVLLDLVDTTMLDFCITNDDGKFVFNDVVKDEYLLQITYIGYKDYLENIGNDWNDEDLVIKTIDLEESTEVLQEVEVKAERIPMGVHGDTISYNANAFKTKPNATVEDLLKKLPGIEVERNGNIKAQGEDIEKVLVDGKEFFGDDPTMATKNLQAEAVDKVEVFDKKSEIAEFTGIDDGNEERTINLKLKEDHKNGGFGNVDIAKGNDGFYDGRLNYSRFSPKMQASFIAARNNVNEPTFSTNDMISFMGGIGAFMSNGGVLSRDSAFDNQGFNTSTSFGTNFNYDFNKELKLNTHYILNRISNVLDKTTNQKNLAEGLQYNSESELDNTSSAFNNTVNSKLTFKLNPLTEFVFYNNFKWENQDFNKMSVAQYVLDAQPIGMTSFDNVSNSKSFGFDSRLLIKRKFAKKGRNIISNIEFKRNENNINDVVRNTNNLNTQSVSIHQNQDYNNDVEQFGLNSTYTEPLGKKTFLGFSYAYENNKEKPNRQFYDLQNGSQVLNSGLSSEYFKEIQYHNTGLSLRRNKKKLKTNLGLNMQFSSLLGIVNSEENIERSYSHFLPSVSLDFKFKSGKSMRLNYRTNVLPPRLEQLLPIPDNANPNTKFIGNPLLDPEYSHNLGFNYNLFDNFNFTNLFINLNVRYSESQIVYKTKVDQNLFNTVTPINSDRFLNLNSYFSFSRPFRPLKLKYRIRARFSMSNYNSFLNANKSVIDDSNLNFSFSFSNRETDHVFVETGVTVDRSTRSYEIDPSFNQVFYSIDYFVDSEFYLPKGITFKTGISYNNYSTEGFVNPPDMLLWNASLSKLVFNDKLEFSIMANDILDQNVGYERFGTGTTIQEEAYNTIGRFFMIGANYKIGKGKKQSGIQVEID
mgnify:CR=1 FL=1